MFLQPFGPPEYSPLHLTHTKHIKTQFVSTIAMGAARALASEEQTSKNPCATWNSRDQFR